VEGIRLAFDPLVGVVDGRLDSVGVRHIRSRGNPRPVVAVHTRVQIFRHIFRYLFSIIFKFEIRHVN
jgi:hypothetical protein